MCLFAILRLFVNFTTVESVLCIDVKSGGQVWPGWRGRPAQPSPGQPWPGWALTTTVVVTMVTVVTRLMEVVMVMLEHVRWPEVRCSAVRTQDTHHTPPAARTCAAVIQDVPLHATLRLLGWPLCHLLSSFMPCCSAIVHCGKCCGVGWCKSAGPVSGELLRQLCCVRRRRCDEAAQHGTAQPYLAQHGTVTAAGVHSAHSQVQGTGGRHHLQGAGGGGHQRGGGAVSSEQQQAAVPCWLLVAGLCWAWPVQPGQDRGDQ